jgi:hypothetical protein
MSTDNKNAMSALMDSYKKLLEYCYDALAPDADPKDRETLRESLAEFMSKQ